MNYRPVTGFESGFFEPVSTQADSRFGLATGKVANGFNFKTTFFGHDLLFSVSPSTRLRGLLLVLVILNWKRGRHFFLAVRIGEVTMFGKNLFQRTV